MRWYFFILYNEKEESVLENVFSVFVLESVRLRKCVRENVAE